MKYSYLCREKENSRKKSFSIAFGMYLANAGIYSETFVLLNQNIGSFI